MTRTAMKWMLSPLHPSLQARTQSEAQLRKARHGEAAQAITLEELCNPGLTADRRRLLEQVVEILRADDRRAPLAVRWFDRTASPVQTI